jgi:ribosomal protein L33
MYEVELSCVENALSFPIFTITPYIHCYHNNYICNGNTYKTEEAMITKKYDSHLITLHPPPTQILPEESPLPPVTLNFYTLSLLLTTITCVTLVYI